MQAYLENGLGLLFGQTVQAISEAEVFAQALGPACVITHFFKQFLQRRRIPAALHQSFTGVGRRR